MGKWILVYLSIIFMVFAGGVYARRNDVYGEQVVSGAVVDSHRYDFGKKGIRYCEVIEFELNGRQHRFTSDSCPKKKSQIGTVRKVAVDPKHPERVRVCLSPWLEERVPLVLKQNTIIFRYWLWGCIFFGIGWFELMSYYEFFKRAIIVSGQVTERVRKLRSRGIMDWYEVVTYHFSQTRKVKSDWCFFPAKIGTARQVGIDPNNTQNARVRNFGWIWLYTALVSLLPWWWMLTD